MWLRAANGFGKTTLLRVLAGLAQPGAGSVEWRDDDGSAGPPLYLAHANALKDDLTVAESLRYLVHALHGLDASDDSIGMAIRRLGLQAKPRAPIRTLSQGQRRRVALCRLCLSRPHGDLAPRRAVRRARRRRRRRSSTGCSSPSTRGAAAACCSRAMCRPRSTACRTASRRGRYSSTRRRSPHDRACMNPASSRRSCGATCASRRDVAATRCCRSRSSSIAASLFPLGVGPEPQTLRQIAPGIVWVCALLAAMLSVGASYASDHHDGSLDQMLLASGGEGYPALAIALSKALAHWLLTGLPLTIAAPLLGLLFGMAGASIAALAASLLLGTPILSLLGNLGAALTLGVRSGGVLLILLVLPLCIPALIFGSGAVVAIDSGLSARGHFSLLGALLILTLLLAPPATAAALRIATE